MDLKDIIIRGFRSDEWALLRDLRLKAIKEHQAVYTRRYEDEDALSETDWRDRISQRDGKIFGLYDGWQLIGLTGVFSYWGDTSGKSAVLGMSYIDAAYRGLGLSRLLYQARIDWAKAAGFERVVVSHRDGNNASRAANAAFGFKATHSEECVFGDGSRALQHFYELKLK